MVNNTSGRVSGFCASFSSRFRLEIFRKPIKYDVYSLTAGSSFRKERKPSAKSPNV